MNKKIVSIILSTLLISIIVTNSAIANEFNTNDVSKNQNINLRLLIAIGLVNINTNQNEINGFIIVGYNAGELITFQTISIKYQGIPFVVTKSLLFTFCIYLE